MVATKDPAQSSASGVTLNTLVERVRSELEDRVLVNVLNASVDASATTLEFKYTFQNTPIANRGALVSLGDEVVYVISGEASSKTLTVIRGWLGTTAASHSVDSVAYFGGPTRKHITDAINNTLDSLPTKGIYQMRSTPITGFNWHEASYQLSDISGSDVYDVQYLVPGTTTEYRSFPGWRVNNFDNTIIFNCVAYADTLRVIYRAPFTRFSSGTDDIQSVAGLSDESADVLVYGACCLLTASEEYKRNDFRSQGDTRRPQEVATGAMTRSYMVFEQIYNRRLAEERNRLRKRYPVKRANW